VLCSQLGNSNQEVSTVFLLQKSKFNIEANTSKLLYGKKVDYALFPRCVTASNYRVTREAPQ
jgi:hypothetical protein